MIPTAVEFWAYADTWAHRLNWMIPRFVERWVCDRYDAACGMTADEYPNPRR